MQLQQDRVALSRWSSRSILSVLELPGEWLHKGDLHADYLLSLWGSSLM